MAETPQLDDFGEKIGGAKKDLWRQRGLVSDDLSSMNSREADKYVRKDYVWKKPDYQDMIDRGLPIDVAFYIKTVRDMIDSSPRYFADDSTTERRSERQKQYIDTIRDIERIMMNVKTKADVMAAFARVYLDKGYMEQNATGRGPNFVWTQKGRSNPVISSSTLLTVIRVSSEGSYDWNLVQKAASKQFGVPKGEKIPKGFDILFNDGKHTYSTNGDWMPDTFYVVKGHQIMQTNFLSRSEALRWLQDHAKNRAPDGKLRFTPPQLEHIVRNGLDYRRGKDVTGQDYLNTFGFRGGEFGNWMSQADRQASLNMGYDALKDLADALKISDQDISYQGALAIAFGARGSGRFVAHYESMRQVINLTKMKGAGSLAHEWWHGLDDYLGTKMGAHGMLSEKPGIYPLFAKLIDTIKYKPETQEQTAIRVEKADARLQRNAEGWLDRAVLTYLNKSGSTAGLSEYEKLKAAYLCGEPGSVNKLSDLKKSVTGRVIPKADREQLYIFERVLLNNANREGTVTGKIDTDYFAHSKRMGQIREKHGGYWQSNTEMTARAFATYIQDTLSNQSDYLVGHAECAVAYEVDKDGKTTVIKAYPEGEERKAINMVFDEIITDLKLQQYLSHDDRPPPEPLETSILAYSEPTVLPFRAGITAEQMGLFDSPNHADMNRIPAHADEQNYSQSEKAKKLRKRRDLSR